MPLLPIVLPHPHSLFFFGPPLMQLVPLLGSDIGQLWLSWVALITACVQIRQ